MIDLACSDALETNRAREVRDALVHDRCASRLFAGDATLWGTAAEPEARTRLGWVDPFPSALASIAQAEQIHDELRTAGVQRIVLCGMGGSSLAPEVLARRDWVSLTIVDSTHPDQVASALQGDLTHTAVVVSSKSGGTIETLSQLAAFEHRFTQHALDPTGRIIIVTDPGSQLHAMAEQHGYRVVFGDPNIGGRFSALSAFGMVPFVLAGGDARGVLREAQAALPQLQIDSPENPAIRLAAACVSFFPTVHTIALVEPAVRSTGIGDWIEQLVAESTGKDGIGVLPLVWEPHDADAEHAAELPVITVQLGPELPASEPTGHSVAIGTSIGAQFLLWEVATALICRVIGVNPFDQPDVESAKVAARAMLDAGPASDGWVRSTDSVAEVLSVLRAHQTRGGYVAVQAWADRHGALAAPLRQLRARLATTLNLPVTLGWGPRYLHSTGQLHKGGIADGLFLQVVQGFESDVDIPTGDGSFGALFRAQADGDRRVLTERGRTVLRIDEAGLNDLLEHLST